MSILLFILLVLYLFANKRGGCGCLLIIIAMLGGITFL